MVSPSSPASGNPEPEPVSRAAEGTQPKGQPLSQTAGLFAHPMYRVGSSWPPSVTKVWETIFNQSTMDFCSPQYIIFHCRCQVRVIHAVKKTGYIQMQASAVPGCLLNKTNPIICITLDRGLFTSAEECLWCLNAFQENPFPFFALHPTTKLLPYLSGIFITDKLMREWDRLSKFATAVMLWANSGRDTTYSSFQVLLWEETWPSVQLWCWQGPVGSLGRSFPPLLFPHLDGVTLLKEAAWR